jgi:hypothetical protein
MKIKFNNQHSPSHNFQNSSRDMGNMVADNTVADPMNSPDQTRPKLTRFISHKKILVPQKSPDYSGTWTQNSSNPEPRSEPVLPSVAPKVTRFVDRRVVEKKVFGLPASMILFLVVMGSVLGVSVYVKNLRSTVKVAAVDFSTFNPNTLYGSWSDGQSFDIVGGQEIVRGFTISNTATGYAMDSAAVFTAQSNGTFVDNDCQIQILDSDSTSGVVDTSVQSGQLSVTGNYNNIAAGASRNGRWKIICRPEFSNTVSIQVQMTPTSKFTYG